MLRRRFVSLLSLPAFTQEPAPIRVDVNLVNVPFSVRDSGGQLIKSLKREDVEVFEDGELQTVSHFSQGSESVLALGLLADISGSQRDFLKDHRRHLADFLKSVMLPADQSFLIGFGNQIRLISPFTHDSDRLLERLTRSQKDDIDQFPRIGPREIREGGTAFYDAVHTACEDLLSRADTGRRALILFSDGEDNASAHHLLDAIECAQRVGATIFSLRYTDLRNGRWTARNKYGRSVMERLARETGGLDFDAGESDNLRASFRQIADLLRASYDLAYKSSHTEEDGAFRKIQIRSKRPGVTLRHKTGYFARTPESGVR